MRTKQRLLLALLATVMCNFDCSNVSAEPLTDPRCQSFSQAYRKLDKLKFKETLPDAEALVKRYPNDANSYLIRAKAFYGLGRLKEALVDFRRALQLNPAFKQAAKSRAEMLRGVNDNRGSVAAFEHAMRVDPCDDEIVLLLRPIYKQLGMDEKHYKQVYVNNKLWDAVGLEKKGKSEAALKLYNEYLKEFPTSAIAYQYRANLYFYAKDYKRALADYQKSLEIYPHDAGCYTSVAACLDVLGDGETACKYFERSLELATNALGYQYRYGNLLRKLKKYNQAITLYSDILKNEPESSDALRFRGDCYFAKQKYKEALADYTSAIDTSAFPSPDTYKQRALVYEKLQQPEKAKRDREKARDLL